jgi:hypothetical protein
MIIIEPIDTVPALQLSLQEMEVLSEELHAYQAIYIPLFRRRAQRQWSERYRHSLLLELPRKSIEPMVLGSARQQDYWWLDRRLYLPQEWSEDEAYAERRKA